MIHTMLNTVKKYAIAAQNAPQSVYSMLKNNGFTLLYGGISLNVQAPVKNHTDMQICGVGGGVYVCCPELYKYYKSLFDGTPYTLLCGEHMLKYSYPGDCVYNAAVLKDFAIANFDCIDPVLKNELKKAGKKFINIKQGYAKCSICIVSDNSFITSDIGIYNTVKAQTSDIDMLLIKSGGIELNGFDYGFIGGASGYSENEVYFCGDIKQHLSYYDILRFITKNGKNIKCCENILTDIGTILFLG